MRDAATEPLITNDSDQDDRTGHDLDEDGEPEHDERRAPVVSAGLFIWGLTICAGVSGLLFGYDTGVISSTLVSIDSSLSARPLTTLDKSLITSSTSFFAVLSSPTTGLLADTLGRKPIILLADILFILGAIIQAFSHTVPTMILGRSIVGLAIGAASFVVPMYIGELAPGHIRGRMIVILSLFVTGGQVVAYLVGWGFSEMEDGWRWMVGLGALPAVGQVGLLVGLGMPESPRFEVKRGRREGARRVLGRVYGGGGIESEGVVEGVLRRIEREIREEENVGRNVASSTDNVTKSRFSKITTTYTQLINIGGNRRALIIACMLQGFQQLCGFNSLMYFSATIFRLVGFSSPTLTSLSIALTNFAFTLVAFISIDRVGRRKILLYSVPIMIFGLALCAIAFGYVDLNGEVGSSIAHTLPSQTHTGNKIWPLVILTSMVLYVAGYAIGLGNVPWQQSELFPLSVRSLGSGIATATNWGSNTLVGLTFLPMMEFLSPRGTFVVYALVCVGGWCLVWRVYPETAGLGLEDTSRLLVEGYGVRESVRGFEERRRRVRGSGA